VCLKKKKKKKIRKEKPMYCLGKNVEKIKLTSKANSGCGGGPGQTN
jgi:hypothetical protein